ERRLERRLIAEFEETVDALLAELTPANVAQATAIVKLYLEIRGYGPVKEQAAAKVRDQIRAALADFCTAPRAAA
ncbi:MAG TPA: DUF6537 domain-containing protein, partial [Woeseiaceae bacterium]